MAWQTLDQVTFDFFCSEEGEPPPAAPADWSSMFALLAMVMMAGMVGSLMGG